MLSILILDGVGLVAEIVQQPCRTRKLIFIKEASAVALFPGGFGTQDEGFEALTLIQTGKAPMIPIVLVERPGGTYWLQWRAYVAAELLRTGMINEEDMNLFTITDSVDTAAGVVCGFYRNYHSMRYVGNDLVDLGRRWAQYLVDHGYVKSGDFVWLPVEVPGATYGVSETKGIASVFDPLGIKYEVTDNTLDQAEVISRMSDYLTANRMKINAIIGLGDLVTGSIKRVFGQVGVAPGQIPVVGWGNSVDTADEVLEGYVKAAMWADPQAISYLGLSMGLMASRGIMPGFNIMTGTLYEADRAAYYRDIMAGK